ncbi:MAG: TonB-dependent receptor [Pseudoxanthomonas sp.]
MQSDVHRYDLPPQPLAQAVQHWGQVSGIQVIFDSSDAEGLDSNAVVGEFAADTALQRLLEGTGLVARSAGSGAIALEKAGTASQSAAIRDQNAVVTDAVNVTGQRAEDATGAQRDIKGYDDVYDLDLSTVYAGKEQIERYKGAAPADVFKGMVNVYSGDARNSGALDPNIRGIQGPGRVPVTIDGTEQALTVWRGYNGANNRNYIDPNLIGGIQVIKGPQLTRNVNTSVGGAVVINTLDVDDILKQSESFGGEVKLEGSNNAVDPKIPTLHTGEVYRSIPDWPSSVYNYYDPTLYVHPRNASSNHTLSGDDYAYRAALGWRHDRFDVMLAYAYRQKGNHYAGKHGSEYYSHAAQNSWDYIPFLANIYKPGDEVPNTSSQMESWLGKLTYRISDDQVLQLGLRKTLSHYGEIMPSRIQWVDTATYGVPQWPLSRVDAKAYNLEYKWQPEGSRWIDLYANAWYTDTVSDTYSSGGRPNDPSPSFTLNAAGTGTRSVSSTVLRNTGLANATNTRGGITLSNDMLLADDLTLTVGGDFQHEKLRSDDDYLDQEINASFRMLPRAGRREEKNFNLKLEWRPYDWLTLNAGMRYQSFWSFDDFRDSMVKSGLTAFTQQGYVAYYGITYYTPDPNVDAAAVRQAASDLGLTGAQYDYYVNYYVYTVKNYAQWLPDADGKFSRATNVLLNGSLDGVDYAKASVQDNYGADGSSRSFVRTITSVDRMKGSGWAPSFSATVHFNDASRLYFSHNQVRRYPSLFESTLGFSASVPLNGLKPEHVYNYEIGYVYDLSDLLHTGDDGHADFKLAYYYNKTKDAIERNPNLLFSNVQKQVIRGIEMQARYDNGRYFADLSAARTLENTVCDEYSAVMLDKVGGSVPDCVDNGFVGGYLVTQAIPEWSANLMLGTRLFDRKVEVGGRVVYYSAFENPYNNNYGTQTIVSYYANTPMSWDRILTYDAYVSYRPRENLSFELVGTNLGNLYYIDPLTRSAMAAPGRTLKLSMNYKF